MASIDQLHAKFGVTAEAAQLLETELGTLLLAECAFENRLWDKSKALEAASTLTVIDKSTLGRVLHRLREKSVISGSAESTLSEALQIRNRLFHSFYREHGLRSQIDEGRDMMVGDLEVMHRKLFFAYQTAGMMSGVVVEILLALKNEPNQAVEPTSLRDAGHL